MSWKPLDQVPSEIVSRFIFEAFHWISQATIDAAAATMGDDNHLPKKTHRVPLTKKIMAPKYIFLFLHSNLNIALLTHTVLQGAAGC
jgi:hypothetical protein